MAKFKKGDKVRIKDNPTKMRGVAVTHPQLTPGTIVTVDRCTTDLDGDIIVKLPNATSSVEWAYISEDSVEPVVLDIHVGDRVRVYNKRTEITSEGVVREIELRDDRKWLWIGKGYDIAADLNNPDGYEFEILECAFKWPDHEGFIRITGGKFKGSRALAYQNADGGFSIRQDWGGYLTSDHVSKFDPEFDFEYVEG